MIKKSLLILSAFFCLTAISTAQQQAGWFTSTELKPGVFVIDDNKAVNVYLVIGKDSALVIDTGMGTADLASYIKKLTDKPLIVINTHGHPDHTGANYQFPEVYIHPADMEAAINTNKPENREAAARAMQAGKRPLDSEMYKGTSYNTKLLAVHEGYIFNLGGRRIKVIGTPGHTAGELVLLDIENRLLFTGDNDNSLVWLFLPTCKPLSEYLVSLEKLQKMLSHFDTIFPGHGPAMPADFINDQVECVKGILDHTLEAKPYKSFAGDAMMSTYKRATVTFDPKNL